MLGHYHIQTNKTDPGPALDWERVVSGAQRILGIEPTRKAPPARTLLTPRGWDQLRR